MTRCKPNTPRAQRGETLAEVLVAMLIVAVSTLLLAAMTAAASNVNIGAYKQDEEFYASMTKVEAMGANAGKVEGEAVIKDEDGTTLVSDIDVEVFHDGDLTLYRRKAVGP